MSAYSKVKKLTQFKYNDYLFDQLWVILDERNSPPVLPLLYTTFLSRYGLTFESKEISSKRPLRRTRELIAKDISDDTIRSYVYCIDRFLSYLEFCHKNHSTPGLHASSSCSEKFVNHYINHVLSHQLDSFRSLNNHMSALKSYFNWLDWMEICSRLDLRIERGTKQNMSEKSDKENYIQYIPKYWRLELLNTCENLGEKLMMRMGYEVGLRTSELTGLRVSGKNNILDLFRMLEQKEFHHTHQFQYWLNGKYCKGSKSRFIYFNRELLEDMKRYFDTERAWLRDNKQKNDDSFFLRTDQRFSGTGIGVEQASRVFRKRADESGLNRLLSFHDLRHTFATDLYHEELRGQDGRETRSESAALLVVAQRLGHKLRRDGTAPQVTTRYIRLRLEKLQIEAAA